jgi:hypothetical protein
MFAQALRFTQGSSRSSIFSKNLIPNTLTKHTAAFRFVVWQKQFGLISNDSSTWIASWNRFHETYTTLVTNYNLNDYLQSSLDVPVDNRTIHTIHIDVIRLSRHFNTFSDDAEELRVHIRRLERILFLFAHSNSANGYCQGYHELLAPLYYVAMKGGTELGLNADQCESVAYFLLHGLINGTIVGDFFMTNQNSSVLTALCTQSVHVLSRYDTTITQLITTNNIQLTLFAFSWITLLFVQSYKLPLILQLWDFLFAEIQNLMDNITHLVVAHIASVRDRLIGCNFIHIMKELSHFEVCTEMQFVSICRHLRQIRRIYQV